MEGTFVPMALQLRVAYESMRGDFCNTVGCSFFFRYKTSSNTSPPGIYKEDWKISLLKYKCTYNMRGFKCPCLSFI